MFLFQIFFSIQLSIAELSFRVTTRTLRYFARRNQSKYRSSLQQLAKHAPLMGYMGDSQGVHSIIHPKQARQKKHVLG